MDVLTVNLLCSLKLLQVAGDCLWFVNCVGGAQVKSVFGAKMFALGVVVKVPVPKHTAKASFQVSSGRAKYNAALDCLVWKWDFVPFLSSLWFRVISCLLLSKHSTFEVEWFFCICKWGVCGKMWYSISMVLYDVEVFHTLSLDSSRIRPMISVPYCESPTFKCLAMLIWCAELGNFLDKQS
jgi:hypothetical protein